MRLHRFIGNFDLSKEEVEITDPEIIKQIRAVLRLLEGDKLLLSDGQGSEAEVTILHISKEKIELKINKVTKNESEKRQVHLYLAILKKENFELAVQKATEVGVASITPIITERTIKTGLNIPRLEKIIKEASEQSGRRIVPILSPTLDFEKAIKDGGRSEEKIIFHLDGESYQPNVKASNASIFIGPEGGFTEKEVAMAKGMGYKVASLGPLTLRGETAAIVASYRTVTGI